MNNVKPMVGDLFTSKAQTLVNTVNCVGVMGKGIALEFKKRFPEMYKEYVVKCKQGKVNLGKPYLFKPLLPPWILNFPTKDHWRSLAKVEDIVTGLEFLKSNYKDWGIESLAIPPLGAGLGQLEWKIIGPILYKHLNEFDIPIELYAPFGTPTDELEIGFFLKQNNQSVLMTPKSEWVEPGWIALIEILHRVQNQPYHYPIGRTTFQKMAYVAHSEGLPLEIQFGKGSYGPFSPDLKKKVSLLMNNGLIKENRVGRMYKISVGPSFKIAQKSFMNELHQYENIIMKVSDLFLRVNTHKAEIISTVIFTSKELERETNNIPSEIIVYEKVLDWKQTRNISSKEVASTIRNLAALGWLNVKGSHDLPVPDTVF